MSLCHVMHDTVNWNLRQNYHCADRMLSSDTGAELCHCSLLQWAALGRNIFSQKLGWSFN